MKEIDDSIYTTETKHETRTESLKLTSDSVTIKFTTRTAKGGTFEKFEVAISKESLQSLLEEMAKSPAVEIQPLVWYTSVRDVTAINNLIKRLYYTLLINENGEIREVSEITADRLKKLVENHGSWIILPTSVETVEEEDLDYSSFEDEDLFARNKMDYLADYCYGNGVMVSYPSLTDVCPIFSYKSWNGKDIQIHNEEDADRFLRVTAIFGVPLFEDSNESDLEEEAQ